MDLDHDRLQLADERIGGKRPELVRCKAEGRREDDRNSLPGEMAGPGGHEHHQDELIHPERQARDEKGSRALMEDGCVDSA